MRCSTVALCLLAVLAVTSALPEDHVASPQDHSAMHEDDVHDDEHVDFEHNEDDHHETSLHEEAEETPHADADHNDEHVLMGDDHGATAQSLLEEEEHEEHALPVKPEEDAPVMNKASTPEQKVRSI